jgi:Flp pilus assembly protein TadD
LEEGVMKKFYLFLIVCSALSIGCVTTKESAERAQYHVSVGKRYMNGGYPANAKSEFLNAARLVPTNADFWGLAGTAARQSGDFDEALQYFMKVAELDPNDSRAYRDIGVVYKQLGKQNDAIASLEKARQLNPEEIGATAMLAEIYYELRDFKKCEYYMNEFDLVLTRTRVDLLSEKTKQAVESSKRKFANYRKTISK